MLDTLSYIVNWLLAALGIWFFSYCFAVFAIFLYIILTTIISDKDKDFNFNDYFSFRTKEEWKAAPHRFIKDKMFMVYRNKTPDAFWDHYEYFATLADYEEAEDIAEMLNKTVTAYNYMIPTIFPCLTIVAHSFLFILLCFIEDQYKDVLYGSWIIAAIVLLLYIAKFVINKIKNNTNENGITFKAFAYSFMIAPIILSIIYAIFTA